MTPNPALLSLPTVHLNGGRVEVAVRTRRVGARHLADTDPTIARKPNRIGGVGDVD